MRFDLLSPDSWDRVCDQYRSKLAESSAAGGDATQTIQVYQGFSPAILECAQGIAKIFSHKKTIAIVENSEPCIQTIAHVFAADGYTVLQLKSHDLENPQPIFDQHKDDLLFVVHADDDPVTGAKLDLKVLPEFFKDKRIFRIHLSHASFCAAPISASLPFEAQILSLAADRALMVGGSRCKIRPTITPLLCWNPAAEVPPQSLNGVSIAIENRAQIEAFEANLPEPLRKCFEAGSENRIFDRAVFWSDEFDGLALIQEIARELKLPAVGVNELPFGFATSAPCYWQSERLVDWRRTLAESDEMIRGLVGVSVGESADSNIRASVGANVGVGAGSESALGFDLTKVRSVLEAAIARLRQRQNG